MNSLEPLRRIAEVEFSAISTFPFHFHNGAQQLVIASPFAPTLEQGFREFMAFVARKIQE